MIDGCLMLRNPGKMVHKAEFNYIVLVYCVVDENTTVKVKLICIVILSSLQLIIQAHAKITVCVSPDNLKATGSDFLFLDMFQKHHTNLFG